MSLETKLLSSDKYTPYYLVFLALSILCGCGLVFVITSLGSARRIGTKIRAHNSQMDVRLDAIEKVIDDFWMPRAVAATTREDLEDIALHARKGSEAQKLARQKLAALPPSVK